MHFGFTLRRYRKGQRLYGGHPRPVVRIQSLAAQITQLVKQLRCRMPEVYRIAENRRQYTSHIRTSIPNGNDHFRHKLQYSWADRTLSEKVVKR